LPLQAGKQEPKLLRKAAGHRRKINNAEKKEGRILTGTQ
jgi:hypothetical protein